MLSIDEEARRRFEADWLSQKSQQQSNPSLSIREYLPGANAESYLGTLEELVCIDLEFRWQNNNTADVAADETVSVNDAMLPTRVEDYLREFPELNEAEVMLRLVEQEIAARLSAGFVVEPSEYESRFPGLTIDSSLFAADGETRLDSDSPRQSTGTISTFPHAFGQYVLTSQIGRGGMGSVYRARQPSAGRDVAIKIADVSSPSAQARDIITQRFETEAHAAAAIVHDHVVPIYDVGSVNGFPFYAMRLVDGGDLSSLTKTETLSATVAARYVAQIANGVEAAHRSGMLHRDIKPQNILIDAKSNRAMLTDFGLARATVTDSTLTHAGQVLGTPSYMPPEQVKDSSKIDRRADVYSLGGTLYQAITGKAPFKASDIHETLKQVLNDDPLPPRRVNSTLPIDIDTIVLKCLEKDPGKRYQTASELADELERFLQGRPILARPASSLTKLVKWSKRNTGLACAIAAVAASLLLALGVSIYGWQRTSQLALAHQAAARTARSALDGTAEALFSEPTFSLPDAAPARRKILTETLAHYETLIEQDQGETGTLHDYALALSMAGNLTLELKEDPDAAGRYFDRASETVGKISTDDLPQNAVLLRVLSDVWIGRATIAKSNQDWESALAAYEQAETLRRRWTRIDDSEEANRKLANAIMNQGLVQRRLGKLVESEGLQVDAQKIRNRFLRSGKSVGTEIRRDSGKANFNLGGLALANGDAADAAQRLSEASSTFRLLAEQTPSDFRLWRLLIQSLVYEAEIAHVYGGQHAEASELLSEAINDVVPLIAISNRELTAAAELTQLAQTAVDLQISCDDALSTEHAYRGHRAVEAEIAELVKRFGTQGSEQTIDAVHYKLPPLQIVSLRQKALLASGSDPAAALNALDQAEDICDQAEQRLSNTEQKTQIKLLRLTLSEVRTWILQASESKPSRNSN